MYNRALSKAYTWLATRLYVLADRVMRQAAEADVASRNGAGTVAGESLPGSPPAHWLDLVRRRAPELYRSVQSRHGNAASPADPQGPGHVDTTLAVQDISADANRLLQSTAQSDAPGTRQVMQGVVSGQSAPVRGTDIANADHTTDDLQTGHTQPLSQLHPTDLRQPEQAVPAQPRNDSADPVLPSQDPVGREQPVCTTSPPSMRVAQVPDAPAVPQSVTSSGADSDVQQPAIEPVRGLAMPDDSRAAASPVTPGAGTDVQQPAIEPVRNPDMSGDGHTALSVDLSAWLATQAHITQGKAGLHLSPVPLQAETESAYPGAVERWPSLPDPVQETHAGPDDHWVALPDDSWTLPLHSGVTGGLRVTDEGHGRDRFYFDAWTGRSWSE
ncbi:MAG: hypothetical protein ABFS24_12325 [Pseudomonadota bacterium]